MPLGFDFCVADFIIAKGKSGASRPICAKKQGAGGNLHQVSPRPPALRYIYLVMD